MRYLPYLLFRPELIRVEADARIGGCSANLVHQTCFHSSKTSIGRKCRVYVPNKHWAFDKAPKSMPQGILLGSVGQVDMKHEGIFGNSRSSWHGELSFVRPQDVELQEPGHRYTEQLFPCIVVARCHGERSLDISPKF